MSQVFSEETHRNLLSRIPHCTGREISDWLRTVDEGPALFRFEEKVSWLRSEHKLAYGHAKAIIHEHDLRRAARKLLTSGARAPERTATRQTRSPRAGTRHAEGPGGSDLAGPRGARRRRSRPSAPAAERLVVALQDGDQPQELQVDPHQGQGEAEGGQPGLLARGAVGDAVLDLLEVQGEEAARRGGRR